MKKMIALLFKPIKGEVTRYLKLTTSKKSNTQCNHEQKSNVEWRMCMDFTNLNSPCLKNEYPLLRIDALINSIIGYLVISFLGAISRYYQIQMHLIDSNKIAFSTREGLHWNRVMPFWLKNASDTYQRMIGWVF